MNTCLSGGGRAAYTIDLDIIKSPSTSHSSSPCSTLSESSNSPLAISTRKPRTPRKRPNQTYNEAAALLSTAYPNIFPVKDICKPCKFVRPHDYSSFTFEEASSELMLPFPVEKPAFQMESTAIDKPCSIDMEEICCQTTSANVSDDFDAESILDEEIEEGVIDSIMGNLSVPVSFCYGYPLGLGYELMNKGGVANALRQRDEQDWWRIAVVDVGEISARFKPMPAQKKKNREKLNPKPSSSITTSPGVLLKLNYDEVLNAWSNRGSPFSDDIPGSELSGTDVFVCF